MLYEHRVRQVRDLPVQPQVDARDRRGLQRSGDRQVLRQLRRRGRRRPVVRQRQDKLPAADFRAVPQRDADAGLARLGRGDARAGADLPAAAGEEPHDRLPVQVVQRRVRQVDLPRLAVTQEPVDDDLPRDRRGDAVQRLGQRRDQHDVPEQPPHAVRLAVAVQPVRERLVGDVLPGEGRQTAGERQPLPPREVPQPRQRGRQMQRRGQPVRAEPAAAAGAVDERQFPLHAEAVGDADAVAERPQVRAAAHADVLAVVHQVAGGLVLEGGRPPAQPGPRLQHRHRHAAAGQRRRGRQARQPPAGNDHPVRLRRHSAITTASVM